MRKILAIVVAVVAVVVIGVVARQISHENQAKTATTQAACPIMTDLSAASKALDEAVIAVNGDKKDEALAALKTAKDLLAKVETCCKSRKADGKSCPMMGNSKSCPMMKDGQTCPVMKDKAAASSRIVNAKCPITGNPIDPAKTPASLTREFNGQKVAFCCNGCPQQWDKLSDKEKQAKLDGAKAPTPSK